MVKEYTSTALDIIGNAQILTGEDLKAISELGPELLDNFLHSQLFRTRTEMEVSVLNDVKHPTPDSKYWQAQREQKVHFHELVMLSYEYRKNAVEIRQLVRKKKTLVHFEDEDERDLLQIEIERKTYLARVMERTAKDRIREIREWSEIKQRLIPSMEHGLEDCDDHQLVSYTLRWIRQARMMGNSGTPSERNNLLSLRAMGIKKCKERRLISKVYSCLDSGSQRELSEQFDLDSFGRPLKRIS